MENAEEIKGRIRNMTHEEMCRVWRFEPTGSPYFSDPQLVPVFQKRFQEFGGMTVEMSKRIGWEGDQIARQDHD